MLLCAEWGVRSVCVPACLYEKFIGFLEPDHANPQTQPNTMWGGPSLATPRWRPPASFPRTLLNRARF